MFSKKNKMIVGIEGMMCAHCASKVESTLKGIDNVSKVKVNLEKKEAVITYNDKLNKEEIEKRISDLEYKVTKIEKV